MKAFTEKHNTPKPLSKEKKKTNRTVCIDKNRKYLLEMSFLSLVTAPGIIILSKPDKATIYKHTIKRRKGQSGRALPDCNPHW